jgi:hypothetical protein
MRLVQGRKETQGTQTQPYRSFSAAELAIAIAGYLAFPPQAGEPDFLRDTADSPGGTAICSQNSGHRKESVQMGKLVRCEYCRGSGSDRHKSEPCRACGGSGQILIPYDNPVRCKYCDGSGADRYESRPCRSCKGAGVTAPGIQLP